PQVGVRLHAMNRIPHGRGLGSSAAATIAGLLLARGLVSDPEALDDDAVLQLAAEFEGHPDNVAPALLGGVVLSWMDGAIASAARLRCAPYALRPVVLLPLTTLSTHQARTLLPATVPHGDAVFNGARAALLVHALAENPPCLRRGTRTRFSKKHRPPGSPRGGTWRRVWA